MLSRAPTPVSQRKGRPPASSAQSSDRARTFSTPFFPTRRRTRNLGGDSSETMGAASRPKEKEMSSSSSRHPEQQALEWPRKNPESKQHICRGPSITGSEYPIH